MSEHIEIEFVAALYPDTDEAQRTLNDLIDMHQTGAIELIDAAVMVRQPSGELSIDERAELTPAKGAKRGALIGAVVGVIFPPAILATAALGAAAGAVAGKVADRGFENELLEELAAELEPGESAILAIVEHTWYEKMMDALEGYEKVLEHSLLADETGGVYPRA